MKSAKEEALRLIQQMPDDASMETILAELHFKCRVQRGLEQFERGEVVTHEEAKERLGRWLNSSGHSMP